MKKYTRISSTAIISLLNKETFYEVSKFSYDYKKKHVYYNDELLEPKIEAIRFGILYEVECSIRDFQNAIYYLARMNTPKPEIIEIVKEKHPLSDVIGNWLKNNNKSTVTISDIVVNCLQGHLLDLTKRQVQMTVGKCLKELGWTKKHTENGNVWISPEYNLNT